MLQIELPNLVVSGRAPWESRCWCVAHVERRWKLWGVFIRSLPCELVALGQESANISVETDSKHSRLSGRAVSIAAIPLWVVAQRPRPWSPQMGGRGLQDIVCGVLL